MRCRNRINTINQKLFDAINEANIADIVNALAEGANIDSRNDVDETPLMTAVRTATPENGLRVINFLLDRGADINAQKESGTTALHLAILLQRSVIVLKLLQNEN